MKIWLMISSYIMVGYVASILLMIIHALIYGNEFVPKKDYITLLMFILWPFYAVYVTALIVARSLAYIADYLYYKLFFKLSTKASEELRIQKMVYRSIGSAYRRNKNGPFSVIYTLPISLNKIVTSGILDNNSGFQDIIQELSKNTNYHTNNFTLPYPEGYTYIGCVMPEATNESKT